MNRLLHSIALLVLIAAAGSLGFLSYRALQPEQPQVSAAFTDTPSGFSLADLVGKRVSTSDYAGQWLLVNFWATWCPPCLEEMPLLSLLNTDNEQLHVIGVALDNAEAVRGFVSKVPVSFPLLIADSNGSEIARQWGNSSGALPFTALLSPAGKIVRRWSRPLKPDLIDAELAAVMK